MIFFPFLLVNENALKANLISSSSGIASCASTSLFGHWSSMMKYSSPDSLSMTAHDYKDISRACTGKSSLRLSLKYRLRESRLHVDK